MIIELHLQNIVLVESADILFGPGLNVLSGETGSGKSAIMNALNLISGDRTDTSMIRKGCEKGVIEALFDIKQLPQLHHFLQEMGIDHEGGNDLLIKREINSSGKSRAFINHQTAQLSLLKQVGAFLFQIVGQHANQKLRSLENHRVILDLFGGLQQEVETFARSWEEENRIRNALHDLVNNEAKRQREIEVCQMEIEELLEAKLKEGEEEELFAEYTHLANAEERANKARELSHAFFGDKLSLLSFLQKLKQPFEQLTELDISLEDSLRSYENALIELQEVGHTISNYENRIEHNPERASFLNDRLALINRLKRKYGKTIDEIHVYLKQTQEKWDKLAHADEEIETMRSMLAKLENHNSILSQKLTAKRKEAAQKLESELISHVRALNMPNADFRVEMTTQKRSRSGDDRIEFFLAPNVGEHSVPLRECASGGELSRVMLALQTLLAGREKIPTLIFDEIDANIGGETASIVGEKLKEIGTQHQVLSITHFHQVARHAHHHLHIFKEEQNGRTYTKITLLNEENSRQLELLRMAGTSRDVK